jgi:hypothetical protein
MKSKDQQQSSTYTTTLDSVNFNNEDCPLTNGLLRNSWRKQAPNSKTYIDNEVVGADVDSIQADELVLSVIQRPNKVHARADVEANGGGEAVRAKELVSAKEKYLLLTHLSASSHSDLRLISLRF